MLVGWQTTLWAGASFQGASFQGASFQGASFQGASFQGASFQGASFQGTGVDRSRSLAGPFQIRGISRADFTVTGATQGLLQDGAAVSITEVSNPMTDVRLQFGRTTSLEDTRRGSFIYVPTSTTDRTAVDLRGSFWNVAFADMCGSDAQCGGGATCNEGACVKACLRDSDCSTVSGSKCIQGSCSDVGGSLALYIADVEKDTQLNSSKYPLNDDVYLYTVYFRQPATDQWAALCPVDSGTGKPTAMAVPLDPFDHSDSGPGRSKFAFACTATGVAAKCARTWGYKPWKKVPETVRNGATSVSIPELPLAPFYDACLFAARADYCQDNQSYTKNGTLVDLFDTLDGRTSINPTVGLPYARRSTGVMLHEEYQISALNLFPPDPPSPPLACPPSPTPGPHLVSENFTCDELMSMPDQGALVSSLRMSGMESSRYADLDPGRTCAAGPYINRCDPKEPYECYRNDLKTQALGAFLAVNSPRHCSHDEEHEGEALDPLCNECVNRVCQVDPTCCADPGGSFYPGSLVWDSRCTEIRRDVCRDDATPSSPLWPVGTAAPAPENRQLVFLRGAIGSFEGIVTEGGTAYAEGWACDPDHPGASVNVQMAVGAPLGATNPTSGSVVAHLYTAAADRPLVPKWREAVAAECGDHGMAPHGFKFPIPPDTDGADIYVYGIDLEAPGAPFSLLRGGKKTKQPALATAPGASGPRAAIWTGWVAAPTSGDYKFQASVGAGDQYRLWINGIYAAGNWTDADGTAGGFFLTPPSSPPVFSMLGGARYSVRVEYRRPDTLPSSSRFSLSWAAANGGTMTAIPASALYPIAQSVGNGLVGTYYTTQDGHDLPEIGNAATRVTGQTFGVDFLWNDRNPPVVGASPPGQPLPTPLPGLSVADTFGARFEGQIIPPLSGDYTFTADSDGDVTITVNDKLVTAPSAMPVATETGLCPHSICKTGAAISKTCSQGFFCASQICRSDPSCCAYTWDSRCVQEVASLCGLECDPSPPVAITLQAGVKYKIRVDYIHRKKDPEHPRKIARGARLQLRWALPGTLAEPIPLDRQFSDLAGAPAGVGLNAAYFVPDTSGKVFGNEYFGHVEGWDRPATDPAINFTAAVPPVATRTKSMICDGLNADACPTAATGGAPALVSPSTAFSGTTTFQGAGAVRATAVDVYECLVDAATGECARDANTGAETWNRLATSGLASNECNGLATTSELCGTFSVALNLGRGTHWLAATQSPTTSPGEGRFRVVVTDPAGTSAPAPTATQPPAGFASGNGAVPVGGTATPGAEVTVTATSGTTTKTFRFTADGSGAWGGSNITLPPGQWTLTITERDAAGNASAATPPRDVTVALPPLTLSAPAEGASITQPTSLVGSGAVPVIDGTPIDVIIGDGDGNYFADRAGSHGPVQPGGTFSKLLAPPRVSAAADALTLDYGKHKLKAFQRANGLDGTGAIVTVLVPPPPPAVTSIIAGRDEFTPPDNAIVGSSVALKGTGLLRNGQPDQSSLPVHVNVYQGTTKLGETVLDSDTGAFEVSIKIAGAGPQTLTIKQAASSLSGAGAAESEPVTITVRVRPPAPTILTPQTAAELPLGRFAVTGSAIAGATVTILADSVIKEIVTAGPDGNFTTAPTQNLLLPRGVHRLTAYQTIDGADGPPGTGVMVSVGDVEPPRLTTQSISVVCNRSTFVSSTPILDPQPTCSDDGANVHFAGTIALTDNESTFSYPGCDPATHHCFAQCIADGGCSCIPDSPSSFAYGATDVTCSARDEATNVGSARLTINVSSTVRPTLQASGLLAEAQGPAGAAVNYEISATGFVANCTPVGSTELVPCSHWSPAYGGLGFVPVAVAMDLSDGAIYAGFFGDSDNGDGAPVNTAQASEHLLASADGGTSWVELRPSGAERVVSIASGGGSLYVASGNGHGVRSSDNRGLTWSAALEGRSIRRVWIDPTKKTHAFAADFALGALFETRDGGATWSPAGAGFPSNSTTTSEWLLALAIDPTAPDRVYTSVRGDTVDSIKTHLYRRVGTGTWERLKVPADNDPASNYAGSIAVVPFIRPDKEFAKVFAGTVMSEDGGESWVDIPAFQAFENLVFSTVDPNVAYASTFGNMWRSPNGGETWDAVTGSATPLAGALLADFHDTETVYASSGFDPLVGIGLYKTTNSGFSWLPVGAPNASLPGARIKDLAADPGDANIAYLISDRGGVFKTTDGGASWNVSNGEAGGNIIDDPFSLQDASKIAIDPFARNKIYAGRIGLWQSADSGRTWTDRRGDVSLLGEITNFAVHPLVPNALYLGGGAISADASRDVLLKGTTMFPIVYGNVDKPLPISVSYNLQIVPNAQQTLVKSWSILSGLPTPLRSGVSLHPIATLARTGGPVLFDDEPDIGLANVVYDGSDGTDRLFVGGGGFTGTQGILYRTEVGTGPLATRTWEPLLPGGPPGFSDFSRLVIDPASHGQTMYTLTSVPGFTLGAPPTLWQSNDGGRNWRPDLSVPPGLFVTNIWLSPADGSLYATLAPTGGDTSGLFHTLGAAAWSKGLLWKRTTGGLPSGARAVIGTLRPQCTVVLPDTVPADDPRRFHAVGPGSTFPLDVDTTVDCKAVDAFGNDATSRFVIQVRDTTPPVISHPAQVFATVTAPATSTNVRFILGDNVSAVDLVDGPITPSCRATKITSTGTDTIPSVNLAGTLFTAGAWTMTCTATDAHLNSSSVSFPLIVSQPTAPTINTPGPQTRDAARIDSDHTGAMVSFTVTAASGSATHPALIPTCEAPIGDAGAVVTLDRSGTTFTGLFPIGTREVNCSATDSSPTPALRVARSFPVTVVDRPPTLTVPTTDIIEAATDISGQAVNFVVTATDAVDGALDPLCSPSTGSTFPIGTTVVTCNVTDSAGNRVADSFNVKVTGVRPILHLPTLPRFEADHEFGHEVSYVATASDAIGPLAITCEPQSGNLFPVGDTIVTCRAGNAIGVTEGSFVVRVTDTGLPDINVPPTITLEAAGPDGSPVTFTRSAPPAEPTITVAAVDLGGQTLIDPAGNPMRFVVSTFDLVSANLVPTCHRDGDTADLAAVSPGPPQFPVGENAVNCSATDGAGNTRTSSFSIIVRDTTPPELHLPQPTPPATPPAPAFTADADAQGGATVNYDNGTNVTATDKVSRDVRVACTPRSGSRFLVGATTVACIARDAAGNEATGSFVVLVRDGSRGRPCTSGTQCGNGMCVDGVCCDSACGGGDPNDCQACSVAAGGAADGACTPLAASHVCRPSADICDVAESCDGQHVACPVDGFVAEGTRCRESTGICDVAEACTGSSAACPTDAFVAAGTTCRASAGVCDPAETCSGSSAACPGDVKASTSTTCRLSTGFCDVAETCDGSSNDCPQDRFVDAGTICRPGAGACDVAEACTGSSGACPLDGFVHGGTTCRPSAGVCDRDETCTGTSAVCPADAKAPVGTVCRAGGGVGSCDVAEVCDGVSNNCPPNVVITAGTVCRPSAGVCDAAEVCNGSSGTCPPDAKAPAGTVCRGSVGTCDVTDTCDGLANNCPPDVVIPSGTVCRASAGACDVAEVCNGSSGTCPPDAKVAAGTTCRAAAGACDVAEACNGSTNDCPANALAAAGTICRASGGGCDPAETCTGSSATCPADTGCGDTDPPYFPNPPGPIVAYATCKDGAVVTYTTPIAIDAVEGPRPVSCLPLSGSMFAPGKTTVTCTASDTKGNTAKVTFEVWVKFQAPMDGTFFLQPINSDGSSVFKAGSVVPVKFKLTGASAGITNLVARLSSTKVSGSVPGPVNEATSSGTANTGNTFRYDPVAKQYVFNLSTKGMSTGVWSLRADLGDLVTHTVNISLR